MRKFFIPLLIICLVFVSSCDVLVEAGILPSPTPTLTPTPTPTPTPMPVSGIDVPVTADGIEFLFEKAGKHIGITASQKIYLPEAPYNIFMVVDAEVSEGSNPCEWGEEAILLHWKKDSGTSDQTNWSICSIDENKGELTLAFASIEQAEEYKIELPGGKLVPLERIIVETK